MEPQERRMMGDYIVKHSISLGGKEVVFAESENPAPGCKMFRVAKCKQAQIGFQQVFEYQTMAEGNDYLTMMRNYLTAIESQINVLELDRAKRALPQITLTKEDCIPDSRHQDFRGQVLVYDPKSLLPEYRTADHQLVLATGGNGCSPTGRGTKVYYVDLYSGEETYSFRDSFAGIVRPEAMPDWARKRLGAIQQKMVERIPLQPGTTTKIKVSSNLER